MLNITQNCKNAFEKRQNDVTSDCLSPRLFPKLCFNKFLSKFGVVTAKKCCRLEVINKRLRVVKFASSFWDKIGLKKTYLRKLTLRYWI